MSALRPKNQKRDREAVESTAESGVQRTLSEAAISSILLRNDGGSLLVVERRFRAHFGASPSVAARCWDLLQESVENKDDDGKKLRFVGVLIEAIFLLARGGLSNYGMQNKLIR